MTGPSTSIERKGVTNTLQASADAFSEQLALQVAALVREAAAGHEVLLRRQLLVEKDRVSKLRSEHPTLEGADRDGNSVACEVPRSNPPCNDAASRVVRFESDKVATAVPVDAALSVCAQPDPQYFDVPRLQQVERAFEKPRVQVETTEQTSPKDGPPSAGSARIEGSDRTSAPSACKSYRPSSARSMSLPSACSGQLAEGKSQSHTPLSHGLSAASILVSQVFGSSEHEMRKQMKSSFNEFDQRRVGRLNAANVRSCVQNLDGEEVVALDCRIADAIEAFNEANPQFQPKPKKLRELTFDGFFHIMVTDNLDTDLSAEEAAVLTDIKTVCVNEATLKIIAKKAMVDSNDITGKLQRYILCDQIMDALSGFVICINALCIGIQLDVEENWLGWKIFEVFFTCFFIFELIYKMRNLGCLDMFFGDDWRWSLFDTLIVTLATVDMVFWLGKMLGMKDGPSLRNFSIMRLSRLMRITRVVRLLRLKFFKDLTIMINGVIGGLKTLFWALVLLLIIIYIVGVMLRQVVVSARIQCTDSFCSAAQKHLRDFEPHLFSNCFRSMFTVFRCLTDGCSSADGTPLVLYFWDAQGPLFVVVYVFVLVFILFGIFNLISAIFVEKTLEFAKLDTAKRREARYKEEVRVAREFRTLVLKICARQESMDKQTSRKTTGQRNMETLMSGIRSTVLGGNHLNDDDLDIEDSHIVSTGYQLTISRERFEIIMNDESIRARMEDLEIPVISSAKLFDILDSNGSGVVDVVELTEGLMSLRGPADKGDIVSSALLVKSTQKMVKDMHDEIIFSLRNQSRQLQLLNQLDAKFTSRMATQVGVR